MEMYHIYMYKLSICFFIVCIVLYVCNCNHVQMEMYYVSLGTCVHIYIVCAHIMYIYAVYKKR